MKRQSAVKQPLSLRGAKRRGNPHPLYAMCKYTAVKKEKRIPTTSVSTGLGMTVVFYTLPSLFSTCTYYQLEQSAKDAPSKNHPVGDGLCAVPQTSRLTSGDKSAHTLQSTCHSETSSQTGRGNPFLLVAAVCFMCGVRGCGLPRRFAPRNDRLFIPCSIIHRLPLWKRESRVKTTTAIPLK